MSLIQAQTSGKELRYVRCDAEGRLTTNLEATIDDVLMKGETSGGVKTPIRCNTDGELIVAAGSTTHNVKLEDITSSINSGITNDPPNSLCVGLTARQTINDSSSQTHLKCDGSGILSVKEIGTVNTAPSNIGNSSITDSVTNSTAVGLYARTNTSLASSLVPLKASAAGVLEVSSSGGGSGNANTFPTLASITTATSFAGGVISSNYIDLTNAKNVLVNCIHTGNATARTNFGSDIAFSMEFTDDDTNTVCYSGASTPVFAFSTIDAAGNSTGDAVAELSLGDRSDAGGSIKGKFGRVVCVNNDASLTGTAYAVTFKVVIDGI